MRRFLVLAIVAGLLFAGCAVDPRVEITNPCSHPVQVLTSDSGVATTQERDARIVDGYPVGGRILPAYEDVWAGGFSDSGEGRMLVWVDEAGFVTEINSADADPGTGWVYLELPPTICDQLGASE